MAVVRKRNSFAHACTSIVSVITIERAAEVARVKTGMVYKWQNPNNHTALESDNPRESFVNYPNIAQALAMDIESMRHGAGTPIYDLYGHHIRGVAAKENIDLHRCHVRSLLDIASSFGELAEEIRKATDPDSEDGEDLSRSEAAAAYEHTLKMEEAINHLQRKLRSIMQPNLSVIVNSS